MTSFHREKAMYSTFFRCPAWISSLAGVVVLTSSPVAAQTPMTVEGPALEFRTNMPWGRLALDGPHSISGVSPLRVPGPLQGEFWVTATGPGAELQRGRVSVTLDDGGSRIFAYGGVPFRQSLQRAVLYPGFAQLRSRQPTKGFLMLGLGTAGVTFSIWAHHSFQDAEDLREELSARLAQTTDPSERATLEESIRDARAEENHLLDRRDMFLLTTGVIWGVNLFDGLLFAPRYRVIDADATSLTLGMRRRSLVDAAARSAVFPGLGQEYSGHPTKGLMVGTGAVLAGAYLLYRQDDLAGARAELREAERRLAANNTVENREKRDAWLDNRKDRGAERDTAVKIAVAYWALSLVDTVLSFEEPWGTVPVGREAGSLGLVADPLDRTLAAQVRF